MDTETINYRGYTIAVEHDDCPQNPWTDWDCNPPLLVVGLGRGRDITGYGLDTTPPELNVAQVKEHAKDIAAELGRPTLLRALRAECPMHLSSYVSQKYIGTEVVNDTLAEHATTLNGADITAFLAKCWEWAGCVALDTSTQGYCQGDYADLLLVATPDWVKETDIKAEDIPGALEHAAKLYGYWCWGNVYGYTATAPEGDDTNSCWGFYGTDHEESGLLEDARNAIDCEISYKRRAHLAQVKVWIKHRVPLHYRRTLI